MSRNNDVCKFTPLGFETRLVDMPLRGYLWCKFTPLGFETEQGDVLSFDLCLCKFTPLGFETSKNKSNKK